MNTHATTTCPVCGKELRIRPTWPAHTDKARKRCQMSGHPMDIAESDDGWIIHDETCQTPEAQSNP